MWFPWLMMFGQHVRQIRGETVLRLLTALIAALEPKQKIKKNEIEKPLECSHH